MGYFLFNLIIIFVVLAFLIYHISDLFQKRERKKFAHMTKKTRLLSHLSLTGMTMLVIVFVISSLFFIIFLFHPAFLSFEEIEEATGFFTHLGRTIKVLAQFILFGQILRMTFYGIVLNGLLLTFLVKGLKPRSFMEKKIYPILLAPILIFTMRMFSYTTVYLLEETLQSLSSEDALYQLAQYDLLFDILFYIFQTLIWVGGLCVIIGSAVNFLSKQNKA